MDRDTLSAEDKHLFPILIVSRRTSIRLTVQRFLSSSGYYVHTAEEGEEAIETDRDFLSQLLIIDTPLADMPLEQLLIELLGSRNLMKDVMQVTNVPVILLSSGSEVGLDERKYKKYGILARMDKPVNLNMLGSCVHDVLTGKLSIEEETDMTIAIMDPEKRALDYFAKLLTSEEVEIVTCNDEIDLNSVENVSVLIVEVMGLNTDDPCEFIRKYAQQHASVQILVTTAFHDDDMSQDMLNAGAARVITKPINPIRFRQYVREAMTKYQNDRRKNEGW
ncbi:MAG: response regulator [Spartobacteria bacterium]|nr:response regulator [Spartobacteria bacterium]